MMKKYGYLILSLIILCLLFSNVLMFRLYHNQIISNQPNFIQFYNKQKIICLYNDACRFKYSNEKDSDKIMINGYEYYLKLTKEQYKKEYSSLGGINNLFLDDYWSSEYFKASPVVLNYYNSLSVGLNSHQKSIVAKCLLDAKCAFNSNQIRKYVESHN